MRLCSLFPLISSLVTLVGYAQREATCERDIAVHNFHFSHPPSPPLPLPLSPSPYPPPLSLSSSLGIWDNRGRATNQLNSLWLLRPEAFWRTQVSVLEKNMTKARELYDEARRAGFPQARNLWFRLQLLFADRSYSI